MRICSLKELAALLALSCASFEGFATVDLDDCMLSHHLHATSVQARCGALDVPLDHRDEAAGLLSLRFAVVPSPNDNKKNTPIFFFAGGPGQSAMSYAAVLSVLTRRLGEKHDLVFIDQRGTGKSQPLDCPDFDDLELSRQEDQAILENNRACLDRIDVDPQYFTSFQAVHDAEWVRKALDYDSINLLGVSYGTRMAQLFAKAYPQRARSLILDSVLPLDAILGQDHSDNLHRAMDELIAICKEDASCSKAFPDIAADWQTYLKIPKKDKRPISLLQPNTGERLEIQADRAMMDAAVRMLSYSNTTQAILPLLIHQVAQGDWQLLVSQAIQVLADVQGEIFLGMHNSVVCSEDVPYMNAGLIEGGADSQRLISELPRILGLLCHDWPVGAVFDNHHDKSVLEMPALLMSGSLDPVTPPEFGERAATYIPNSTHLVVQGQGHNVIQSGCLPKLTEKFLERLSLDDESLECVNDTPRLPFFIDLAGPDV